jgi:hypothetical protein
MVENHRFFRRDNCTGNLSLVAMQIPIRFILSLWLISGLGCSGLIAQPFSQLRLDQRPPVIVPGDTLDFPWTGGFNSIVPVEIDLDGDGLLDLFLLDRVGNRMSTFINTGLSGGEAYRYEPRFISLLPPLQDWVRSADYDCDGDLDLFTYINSAMGVWRNDIAPGTALSFTLVSAQLNSWYGSFNTAIFVSQVNLPAIVDADGDGDLDIITFSSSSNYLEYHRNYAMDSLSTCNAFLYNLEPYCWGYFKLSGLSNTALLNQNCRSGNLEEPLPENGSRHSGSVLTPLDQDCDGDVDLLNGDILGQNMLFLLNGGTTDTALIVSQDVAFPSYDVPVDMQNLPGAYYLDLDNDSIKDMLVSPFATVGEDLNNLHLYKNTSDNCSNILDLQNTRFLSDRSVDLGTAANVSLVDVDQDGLTDIVAGNELLFNPDPNLAYSRLAYFRNTGSSSQPAFTLVSTDWLGLSGIAQFGLYPAFGDLDADGDIDMLLGNSDGSLIRYTNNAGPGNPFSLVLTNPQYQGIDIGNNSAPQIVDVNRDGKNDLLIGERAGNLNYYENTGSAAAPAYVLASSLFGGVNVAQPGQITGYSSPHLFDNGSGYELLVGSERGYILRYTGIDGNLSGTFTLADSVFQGIFEPRRVTIARSDLDSDGFSDLLAGCNAGGFRLYTHSAASSLSEPIRHQSIRVHPNPVEDVLWVDTPIRTSDSALRFLVMDMLGRVVQAGNIDPGQSSIDCTRLSKGMYVLQLGLSGYAVTEKFVKK